MYAIKMTLFIIGTCGFFAAVYLSIRHPELVQSEAQSSEEPSRLPQRKWDKIATWVMWGGWGCAALVGLLDRDGYLDMMD